MRVLIFACNRIPTPTSQVVEGTGLRYWRMAIALRAAGIDSVTVAVLDQFKPEESSYEGIDIVSFDIDTSDMADLLNGFDTAIFSYAYGVLPDKIIDAASPKLQLISDAYSPYYVEALMRAGNSSDRQTAKFYDDQVFRCNRAIICSDFILYSGADQRRFYEGLLGGMGVLPNFTDRLIELPAYAEKVKKNSSYDMSRGKVRLIWFGGMYPWFDASSLVELFADDSINSIANLTVVGGYNPAYPRSDKRHNQQFGAFYKKVKKYNLDGSSIHFVDWVGYDERLRLFEKTDLAIMVNNIGIETKYSFRIRLADLAGSCVPVVTNGGDPLSEHLIANGAALRFDFGSQELNIKGFKKLLEDKKAIVRARETLATKSISDGLHIESYTADIFKKISLGSRPRLKDSFSSRRVRELSPENIAYFSNLNAELTDTNLELTSTLADITIRNMQTENEVAALRLQFERRKKLLKNPIFLLKEIFKKIYR